MNMLFAILILLPFALIGFSFFMLYRNQWVFNQRIRLIREWADRALKAIEMHDDNWATHSWDDDYLSYDQMMWRFWIWDVEKLRKPASNP